MTIIDIDYLMKNYECINNNGILGFDVMSNFNHKIDEGVEEKLKSGKFYVNYSGYNFYGYVYFDDEFKCLVSCYGSLAATISGNTLQEIMDKCCDLYGYC